MARLNVEDDILSNPRFQALVRLLGGDMEKALGRLVRFWWAAQKHWGHNRGLIPIDEFELGDFGYLAEVGLADKRPGGVYAKGAEHQFEWYIQRIESASKGGKASAAVRRERDGTAVPPNASNRTKTEALLRSTSEAPPEACAAAGRTEIQANPNPPTPSLTHKESTSLLAPPRALFELWNAKRGPLDEVHKLTKSRAARVRARLVEEPDLGYWERCIGKLAASKFATGRTDGRKWKATFDWLVKNDSNHVKVTEGQYDDNERPKFLTPLADDVEDEP